MTPKCACGKVKIAAAESDSVKQESKTRERIWLAGIVITCIVVKYLSEVFNVRVQDSWIGWLIMAVLFLAIVRLIQRRKNSN